jgi:hypothetical protein
VVVVGYGFADLSFPCGQGEPLALELDKRSSRLLCIGLYRQAAERSVMEGG